jgi:hypothetical protein
MLTEFDRVCGSTMHLGRRSSRNLKQQPKKLLQNQYLLKVHKLLLQLGRIEKLARRAAGWDGSGM